MEPTIKRKLTELKKNHNFSEIFKKLILEEELNNNEKSFILSCALLFLRYYERDRRYTTYLEASYYIILKYSISYRDYEPLYDFSLNVGFYPTVNFILKNDLLKEETLHSMLIENKLEDFKDKREGFVQTLEQYNRSKEFLVDNSKKKCYVAPTSYGKSSIIVDYLKLHQNLTKVAIIVPTKSLLNQTYKLIKRNVVNKKILIHNEMYDGEKEFVAIFTQERALKFLEKNKKMFFDLLVIDEAHNLFERDSRNILLSRLIKRNQKLNENQEVIYLSPLIRNQDSLKLFNNDVIKGNLIKFNIKEPTYYEYLTDGRVFVYNHFLDDFYEVDKIDNKFNYISNNLLKKNFLYENSPKKIEELSLELCNYFDKIESEEINGLKNIIARETHKEFYLIKLLDYGIIYLHGKMPTQIKDYLEEKFDKIKDLKFIVANKVILEGINLPIDNMFLINLNRVNMKQLVNLIGRVNRLNNIFNNNVKHLDKLNPKIHFINNKEYNRKENNGIHNPKLLNLRNRFFNDEISNPTLFSQNKEHKDKQKDLKIKKEEEFLNNSNKDVNSEIKKYFIENSLSIYYDNLDICINIFIKNYNDLKQKNYNKLNVLDLIYELFINNLEDNIKEKELEFLRLRHQETRNYYNYYVDVISKLELRDAIQNTIKSFREKGNSKNPFLYFGSGYGEVKYQSSKYDGKADVYVDLSKYLNNETKLVNLAIVKLKMEEDFTSFTLKKFVDALFDFEIILENQRNKFVYGSEDKNEQELFKFGLSKKIINQLKIDKQMDNIYINEVGNISYNEKFRDYINKLDEFKRFELEKLF